MAEMRSLRLPRTRLWSGTDLPVVSTVLIWGINFSVIKVALRTFSPLAFNALRFGLATLLILAILYLRGESFRLARRDLLPVILLGLIGHTLYQLMFINGMALTTPANTSLLMATTPVFVAIYGWLLGSERVGVLAWIGVVLSFVGILLLILGSGGEISLGRGTLRGDLLILGAAMVWAAYTTGSKGLLTRYSPLKLTALSMLAGTPPLVLLSIPQLLRQEWPRVAPEAWLGLAYSLIFAVVVAYVAWYTSVQRVGNARTAIYSNLTPVVAVLVAWLALGDHLTWLQGVGATVVLSSIMLTRRGRASRVGVQR
jgi:drug/metabolite transporter (DMT)-like permease